MWQMRLPIPLFLCGAYVFHFKSGLPGLFFKRCVYRCFLRSDPISAAVFARAAVGSFRSFATISAKICRGGIMSLRSLSGEWVRIGGKLGKRVTVLSARVVYNLGMPINGSLLTR